MPKDYPGAFVALRRILANHGKGMKVLADTPTEFTVISPALGSNRKPLWFGCVTSKKSAVTYHLIPLYYNPKLLSALGPELETRRSGKTCFHFQRPEPDLFAQLDEVTRLGREQWARAGFLEPGVVAAERLAAALKEAGGDPDAVAARRQEVLARPAKRRATGRKTPSPLPRKTSRHAGTATRASRSPKP